MEASLRNRVGLWSCPCKLTWGFIKQFSKVPNPAMCWQSQALELEPHWISLFIWIKISLDTGSPKSEVAGNELLTGSKPEGYWDLWPGRETFRETFPPITEGQTGNQLLRQLYFFKQRKRMCIHFQDMNKPLVWLILGNKPQRKASQKIFFSPCWQNKDACDSVEGEKRI